jgi:hypothetical protein
MMSTMQKQVKDATDRIAMAEQQMMMFREKGKLHDTRTTYHLAES